MNHLATDLEQALEAADSLRQENPAEAAPSPFKRGDVPRELLESAQPGVLLRMAVEEWGMMGILWAAIAIAPWWLYPPIAILLAGRFHALGVVLHDAAHMPLRRKSMAIRMVETLCGYPLATTLNAMRYHHLRHHRDTGMASDPYHKAGTRNLTWRFLNTLRGLALVPFWTARAPFGAASSVFPRLRNPYAHVFLQDLTKDNLRDSPEVADCARAEWGQLLAQLSVLFILLRYPQAAIWGYLVPVSLAGLLAARRVIIEHNHHRATDRRIETILRITRDNHLGLLGGLFLTPRNIGYHIVHHIHPQVRLGALPKLRRWYVRTYPANYPHEGC